MNLKKGQFYYDTVNHDLLKILGLSMEYDPVEGGTPPVVYVRCACIANGNFFGVQEMKVSTLTDSRVADTGMFRFERMGFLEELWYGLKYRDSKLKNPPGGGTGPVNYEQLSQRY